MKKIVSLKGIRYGFSIIEESTLVDYLLAFEPEDVIPLERNFQIIGNVYLEQLFLPQNMPIFEGFNIVTGVLEDGASFKKNMPDGELKIL